MGATRTLAGRPDALHAFHPDYKMTDKTHTPSETLTRARRIAVKNGVRYAYTGNVHDTRGGSTYCHSCGEVLVGRDWYVLSTWNLTDEGACTSCGAPCAGVFDGKPGTWGAGDSVRVRNRVSGSRPGR